MANITYVDSPARIAELAAIIKSQSSSDRIALDTEFDRVTTFYPRLALLQLEIAGVCYLVDPLVCDIAPVIEALCATGATVLMFAAAEDLEVLADAAERGGRADLPLHIADLQLMEGFNSSGWMRSLQTALESELGVSLPKEETRSDWLRRPLTDAQLEYAAQDVQYLRELHDHELAKFAENDQRLRWFEDEMLRRRDAALLPVDPQELYLSVGGAGALSRKEQIRLRYLCARRFEYAVSHDEALNRVITGKALCAIAKFTPMTFQALASCKVNWGAVRQHGRLIIDWVKESLSLEDTELKPPYDSCAPGRSRENTGAALKRHLASRAQVCRVAPELITSKKLINNYFYEKKAGGIPLLEQGWMRECAGELNLVAIRATCALD